MGVSTIEVNLSDYKIKVNPILGEPSTFPSSDKLKEYLDDIGPLLSSVIIDFNALEDEISYYICEMFETSDTEKVYAFIGDLMFKKKAMKLLQLYHIECRKKNDSSLIEAIHKLDKKFKNVAKNRNDITHGSWLFSSPGGSVPVSIRSNNNGVSRVYKQYDKGNLQNTLNQITIARAHLSHFHNRLLESC